MRASERSGFALALAVCMLAVIGGLTAASFFAVREARRSATRFARQEEAASSADAELFTAISEWDEHARDTLSAGSTDSTVMAGSASAGARYVTRITNRVYWVAALGRAGGGTAVEARRVHGVLVSPVQPRFVGPAAVVSRGDVLMTQDARVSGDDRAPPGWVDCPGADSVSAPGVIVPDDRSVRDETGQPFPGARTDSVAGRMGTYREFGSVSAASLTDGAEVRLPPGAMVSPHPPADQGCAPGTSRSTWGDPLRVTGTTSCERFFPVIHAAGDIVVASGEGQGILIVDGRLRIDGPFVFYGVIVAAAGVEAYGGGVSIYGAVLSGSTLGVVWHAGGRIQRSTCAIARAAAGAARPVPLQPRGWSELF